MDWIRSIVEVVQEEHHTAKRQQPAARKKNFKFFRFQI
jgi:hypothetical protein